MSCDLNQNGNKLVEAVAVSVNQIKKLLGRLQKCSSLESIKDLIYEGELKEALAELSLILDHSADLPNLCECFVNWKIVTSFVSPLLFYATLVQDLGIQGSLLQILLRLVEVSQNLDNATDSKTGISGSSARLTNSFIEPILKAPAPQNFYRFKFFPKNLHSLWLLGKILVDNLNTVLHQGWSGDSRIVILYILSLIERLTFQRQDLTAFYSTNLHKDATGEEIVSWLVSHKIYEAIFVFLATENVRESIPDSILCLMVGVIAGPCYIIVQHLGPGFLSNTIVGDIEERSQDNENKNHISVPNKVDFNRCSKRIMRWSSQHNAMVPILEVLKDGERKYGHWEEHKKRNIVSICDGLLRHATNRYKLGIDSGNNFVRCLSSVNLRNRKDTQSQTLLLVEELFNSCMIYISKWLLTGCIGVLSNDTSYVKKLPTCRFPFILSAYIRIIYSKTFQSDTMIHHLIHILDERLLRFLVSSLSRFVDEEDRDMEGTFLTTLADYLSIIFVLISRNEGLVLETFVQLPRIFEDSMYPKLKFQAKQLVEKFFEKEELHDPVIAYFKNLKVKKLHPRPFVDLCIQLLSTLIGLHHILEHFAGSSLNVERTKQRRRKKADDDEELAVAGNVERRVKQVFCRSSDLLMTPLIRSQTFELLLLPFHDLLSNDVLSDLNKGTNFRALSISCRLCYKSWKRLWEIACFRHLRPHLYSATFFAFFYALTLPEAEERFQAVFRDNGEFLSRMRSLSKEIADSFVNTFRQNIVVAVDALFPMNPTTCSYYENMVERGSTKLNTPKKEMQRKPNKSLYLDKLEKEQSSSLTQVARTKKEYTRQVTNVPDDQESSRNILRKRIRTINDDDDELD